MALNQWAIEHRVSYGLVISVLQIAVMAPDAYQVALKCRQGVLDDSLTKVLDCSSFDRLLCIVFVGIE